MAIKLGNTDINKIYLGSTEIKKAYLGSNLIFDNTVVNINNYVINETLDDNNNVILGASWSILNGVATYDAINNNSITFSTVEALEDNTNYTLEFDIINSNANARMTISTSDGTNSHSVASFSVYGDGTQTIQFTQSGANMNLLSFVGFNTGNSFDIDNIKITKD